MVMLVSMHNSLFSLCDCRLLETLQTLEKLDIRLQLTSSDDKNTFLPSQVSKKSLLRQFIVWYQISGQALKKFPYTKCVAVRKK